MNKNIKKYQRGFSLLPVVLVASLIIAEIGIALTFVMYLANSASYDVRLSQEAFFGARSGVNDAFLRIIRNKNFSSGGYNLVVGRVNVNIIVEKNSNFSTITAKGTIFNREKIMQGIVSVDQETGEATLFSLQEI
jgi:hypothetical protein